MTADNEPGRGTRLLFFGEDSLADGFRLIGFETYPDPIPADLERVFRDLLRARENAFVVIEDRLMQADIPILRQIRREGGRIVLMAIPPLREPPRLASEVADRLRAMFGASSMKARESS
ncbi:V-type ATP synthase subunit F [Thioalkalicoccus limnaeus]|uniref:V-type ATP synthase subunit F n=1 Tax=Thioalkalicoccus limnaeus TaxID=120681 RepID=A0ABV4BM55_9GAMM